MLKEQVSKVQSNIVGSLLFAGAGFYLGKRFGGGHKWITVTATIVGLLVGANVQAAIKAKKGAPTAATVKK